MRNSYFCLTLPTTYHKNKVLPLLKNHHHHCLQVINILQVFQVQGKVQVQFLQVMIKNNTTVDIVDTSGDINMSDDNGKDLGRILQFLTFDVPDVEAYMSLMLIGELN